jgi:rubrerythrin
MSVKEYLNVFKEMIDREKVYAKALAELSRKIEHPVLQSIFVGIANDSLKHSQLYEALVKLLTSPQPVLSQEELELLSKEVDKHIETEALMVKLVGELLKEVEDPRLKLVLSTIYNDEVEHHNVLVSVRDNLAKREAVTEEDIWDAIWRDSPWHGTPGG